MGWPTFHSIDQMAAHGANILVTCMFCSNRTALPGPDLVRYFRVRGWPTGNSAVGRHLRCSGCKRTGPTVRPTFDQTGRAWRPPQSEEEWKELERRVAAAGGRKKRPGDFMPGR